MIILRNLSIILIIISFNINVFAGDKLYNKVFTHIKKKEWLQAEKVTKIIGDKVLFKIVLSQQFLDQNYKKNSFDKITKFLKNNPSWPQSQILKSRAESLIDYKTNKTKIYDWFKQNKPITGNGHKYYALVASKIIKDKTKLKPIIQNSWINGCFSQDEQKNFYKKYKKFLTKEDNISRIDNLLWKGSVTSAKRSLHLVNHGYKKSFRAQIAFLEAKKNAYSLFTAVPKKYYTQGLIYQYLKSRKNTPPSGKEVIQLVNLIKNEKGHENSFWQIQCYLTREHIQKKNFNDAYLIASNHLAKSAADVSEAEFLSGWLALRFLKKPVVALNHFKKFSKVVQNPISVARGLYWRGRAYNAVGDLEKATRYYMHAAHNFGYTFYGQVATIELGKKHLKLPPKIILANHKNDNQIQNPDILKAAKLVSKYGRNGLAQTYLNHLIDSTKEAQEILAIALELQDVKLHHKVWMSKRATRKHIFIDNYSFPTPYKIKNLKTEESLTYSIIRQESVFDQHAKSYANAMGLMQLIKPTACETAKKIGLQCNVRNLTQNPNYNIKLGTTHLAQSIANYKNSYILAIAAYNAGPANANKWVKSLGDPRNFNDVHKVIDWIELVPYKQTRDYIHRVLENLQIYRAIIHKNTQLKLKEDLLNISV